MKIRFKNVIAGRTLYVREIKFLKGIYGDIMKNGIWRRRNETAIKRNISRTQDYNSIQNRTAKLDFRMARLILDLGGRLRGRRRGGRPGKMWMDAVREDMEILEQLISIW